jgi:hypothetical protein
VARKKLKVRVLVSMGGNREPEMGIPEDFSWNAGQIVELNEEKARNLAAGGNVVILTEAEAARSVETAALAPETPEVPQTREDPRVRKRVLRGV